MVERFSVTMSDDFSNQLELHKINSKIPSASNQITIVILIIEEISCSPVNFLPVNNQERKAQQNAEIPKARGNPSIKTFVSHPQLLSRTLEFAVSTTRSITTTATFKFPVPSIHTY